MLVRLSTSDTLSADSLKASVMEVAKRVAGASRSVSVEAGGAVEVEDSDSEEEDLVQLELDAQILRTKQTLWSLRSQKRALAPVTLRYSLPKQLTRPRMLQPKKTLAPDCSLWAHPRLLQLQLPASSRRLSFLTESRNVCWSSTPLLPRCKSTLSFWGVVQV